MTDYVRKWKKENPYPSRRFWTGPNDYFTVPAGSRTNAASYRHDAKMAKYESYLFKSVPEDEDWIKEADPKDWVYPIGYGVFRAKSLLPRAKLKKDHIDMRRARSSSPAFRRVQRRVIPPRYTQRRAEITGGSRSRSSSGRRTMTSMSPVSIHSISSAASSSSPNPYRRMSLEQAMTEGGTPITPVTRALNALGTQSRFATPISSFTNASRMPRSFSRFKRRRRISFAANKGARRLGRRGRGRFGKRRRFNGRRFGKRSLRRAIRKLSYRVGTIPAEYPKKYSAMWQSGSVGENNGWRYRIVDCMFNSATATNNEIGAIGWNMYRFFEQPILQIYGAGFPKTGQQYKIFDRYMATTFQAPCNSPTWFEVYLIKPKADVKLYEYPQTVQHPLVLADQGTNIPNADNNPGTHDPYGMSTVVADTPYGVSAIGNLHYNPFTDRTNMKDRFKVVKKWKFVLGPIGSKTIVLKSKKPFMFRTNNYSNLVLGATPTIGTTATANYVDCVKSSRIMIVRWHGFNTIADTAADAVSQLESGYTNDSIIVKRITKMRLQKIDNAYDMHAYNVSSVRLVANDASLRLFGLDATNAGTVPA